MDFEEQQWFSLEQFGLFEKFCFFLGIFSHVLVLLLYKCVLAFLSRTTQPSYDYQWSQFNIAIHLSRVFPLESWGIWV